MTSMLKPTITALVCAIALLGSATVASAADGRPALPKPGGPTPQAVCDFLPIFWWCP